MNRGAWWAAIHGVENELDTTELNNNKVELIEAQSRISAARVWGWGRGGEQKFQILRGRSLGGLNGPCMAW